VAVGQPLDPERARDVEQHAARDQRRDRVGAERGEALRGLHLGGDHHAAVQAEILRLVAERVDVRARVLGHHQQRRGARARLAEPRLMAAVQREQEPRLVGRERRRALVARLLEVVGARPEQRLRELRHSLGANCRPWVSGSAASAQIAST
jgi:hypothetical protein